MNASHSGSAAFLATGKGQMVSMGLRKFIGEGYKSFAERMLAKELGEGTVEELIKQSGVGLLRKTLEIYAIRQSVKYGIFDEKITQLAVGRLAVEGSGYIADEATRKKLIDNLMELEHRELATEPPVTET